MQNTQKLTFLRQKKLPITYLSLVFRVQSIYEKFGTLDDFVNHYELEGITNRELFIITENKNEPGKLKNIFDGKLGSMEFSNEDDCTILFGNQIDGVEERSPSLLNCEIPECRGIDWLGSEITEEGYFIWAKPLDSYISFVKWGSNEYDDKIMVMFQEKLVQYFSKTNPDKLKLNPKIVEIRKGRIWFKMDNHIRAITFTVRHLLENLD